MSLLQYNCAKLKHGWKSQNDQHFDNLRKAQVEQGVYVVVVVAVFWGEGGQGGEAELFLESEPFRDGQWGLLLT